MKSKMLIVTLATLTCASIAFAAGDGDGALQTKDQTRDRIQACDATLEKEGCKAQDALPAEVKDCVKEMAQTREQYQDQLRDQQKDAATCSEEDREQLRERARDQFKDQACDRDQLRDRLCELRECVPTHDEVMEQAKEQTREQRRGE